MNTFIYDASTKVVQMRKKDAGRRKILLDCARRIECEEGVDAVSIRRLASEANVAVGTVYNYFESKQSVLLELTEEYWGNILRAMQSVVTASRFSGQLRQIYTFLTVQMNDCAGILMQNLSGTGDTAQEKMAAMQRTLERAIAGRLEQDRAIRPDVWSECFTREAFAQFVFSYLLALLRQKDGDIETFVVIVERILY